MKLPPQELRLGNYVLNNFDVHNPFKITKISIDSFVAISHGCNSYQPIPLTEEILLKCGFEYCDEYKCYTESIENDDYLLDIRIGKDGSIGLFWSLDSGVLASFNFIESTTPVGIPNSLHQLQNLYFALTGQELNVEL